MKRCSTATAAVQAVLTWKISRNEVVDSLRRIEDNVALAECFEQWEVDHSLVEELHEVIAQLEEPDRTIVRMKLEGYSYKEISQHVELSEKNVSVRLVRVKEKLKQEMTK